MSDEDRPTVEQIYGRYGRAELHDPSAQVVAGRGIWLLVLAIVVVLLVVWAATSLVSRKATAPELGYDGNEDAYRPPQRTVETRAGD